MKSLATQKPPEVHEEVNKFIWVSYSKMLVFNQVVVSLITVDIDEIYEVQKLLFTHETMCAHEETLLIKV